MTKWQDKLKAIRIRSDLTFKVIGPAIGLTPSGYSYYEGSCKKPLLPHDVALKLCEVFVGMGMPPITADEIMSLSSSSTPTASKQPELEPVFVTGEKLKIVGEVQAGVWQESILRDDGHLGEAPIGEMAEFKGIAQYCLIVRGPSMNKIFSDGTTVICISKWDYPRKLQQDNCVIVERTNNGTYESTIKQVSMGQDGKIMLWPRSDDPRFQNPIEYDENSEETTITGIVINKLEKAPGFF